MLVTACSVGFMGMAAEIDYDVQYTALSDALRNEYVRTLTNYKITNTTLENGAEGFDTDANGFAYEHRVTAKDNSAGDIMRAANIFYYIAEHIMSTQYNVGYYNPNLLLQQVFSKLKSRFGDGTEIVYEDFYGNRYYPTAEELEAYNTAASLIAANNAELNEANLTRFNIYFIQKNNYEYFNVETILRYFMGNASVINTGNWYHRYVFVTETSIDTAIIDKGGIENFYSPELVTRTGVYEWDFVRSYNDTKTKAYYAFKAPSAERVWTNYASEFGLDRNPSDLTVTVSEDDPIAVTGQSSAFFMVERIDTASVTALSQIFNAFGPALQVNSGDSAWDEKYTGMSNAAIKADANNAVLAGYVTQITGQYSNESLLSMFGEKLGSIITAAYALTPSDKMPVRTISGTTITLTPEALDEIIYDMDGLVSHREGTNNARDALVANKVATIVKMFFNTTSELFEGTSVYGLEFETLDELVGLLVQGLLFRDSIVNKLIGLLYPLVVDLLEDKVYNAITDKVGSSISGLAESLIDEIIDRNALAIHPSALADRIKSDYGSKCNAGGAWYNAYQVLKAHGSNWYVSSPEDEDYGTADYKGNTDWVDTLDWGIESAPLSSKAQAFEDALCAGLGGFMRVLVTLMCGDAEYTDDVNLKYDSDQFNEYLDKKLANILGVTAWLRAQGGYTKLIIPLFRVLGLTEQTGYNGHCYGYVSSREYHSQIANNGNYQYGMALKLIVQPLIYWVTECLAKKPFETLWNVLPNLVHFLSRDGWVDPSVNKSISQLHDDWSDEEITDRTHGNYFAVQTFSLNEILNNLFVTITINVPILFNKKWNVDVGSLGSLIGKQDMLGSINGLLNELVKFEYKTDVVAETLIAGYKDPATGEVVAHGSLEYELDRASGSPRFTEPVTEYYSDPTETELVASADEDHSVHHDRVKYVTVPYKIPAIQEAKLISCGTVNTATNTIDVEHPGLVLLFVLRYVFSALGYRYDNSVTYEAAKKDANGDIIYNEGIPVTETRPLPFLIECFGLDIDKELFQGFNLKDIIYNVMLHPDDAIWSILELFYSHEDGDYLTNQAYTYDLEKINYHNGTLLNTSINPTLTYGTTVRYTKYWTREYATDVVDNADEFVQNILTMLGMTEFSDGIGKYLENLLNEKVFTNDIINKLFNAIYQLLGGLNDTVGIDIEGILDAALDVSYSTATVSAALHNMLGYDSAAYEAIHGAESWTALFTVGTEVVEGETVPVIGDIELDWGLDDTTTDDTRAEKFCKTVSALLSPVSFLIRFLLLDEDMDILNLVKLPAYAGYQYSIIGLLEALSCPNILTYSQYAAKCNEPVIGGANSIYYILTPILGLLEKVYAEPVDTLLTLLPNLLFVISIGGLNDILNNLVHFAYVLLDILSPIANGYDLLDGLLSNIEVAGISLNLALPLDIDFNALASELIGSLVGDAIEISGVKISLPYIDFHTLCCGTLSAFASKELRSTVYLNAAGGGDMITALLRLVFETLFMDENEAAISEIVANAAENGELDNYDKNTITMIVDELFGLIQKYEVPDMLLFVVYFLVNKLTPISGTLAARFKQTGMTIPGLFSNVSDTSSFISNIMLLVNAGSTVNDDGTTTDEETGTLTGFGSLIARIKAFFQKIIQFFKNLFS